MTLAKRDYFIFGLAGAILLSGVYMVFASPNNPQGAITLIDTGIIMICVRLIRKIRMERHKVLQDERTLKISAYAYTYSWIYSFIFLGLVAWADEMRTFGPISLGAAVFCTMMFMVLSYFVALCFLNRK